MEDPGEKSNFSSHCYSCQQSEGAYHISNMYVHKCALVYTHKYPLPPFHSPISVKESLVVFSNWIHEKMEFWEI